VSVGMNRLAMLWLFATGVVAAQGTPQAPVFRVTADTVPVFVTVTDKSTRLVGNLTREDFQVLDSGRPQPLTLFDNTPQPIRLIVMLDVSASMYGNLRLLQDACVELFARLRPDNLARVGVFGADVIISPAFTHDAAELRRVLPTDISPDARTPLWSALDMAIDAFAGVEGRRVILVLSDGKDTGPLKWRGPFLTVLEMSDRAQREEVMVYAVGLHSRNPPGSGGGRSIMETLVADLPDPGLGRLALETGGGYFEIKPRDDLGAAFARVADELHSQYLLGFAPPARDGKQHKVEVRLRDRDLTPRARKSYQAPKPSK
jgi:Ca-activated chloride channel family protein